MEGIQHQLEDLLRERQRLQQIRPPVPIALSLVDADMMRLQSLLRGSSMLAASNGELGALFPYSTNYLESNANKLIKPSGSIMTKKRLKLPIPAERYPDYNFVGRLLGPRGTTLKAMEKETGCKIMIRGKGSIRKDKEGDVRGKPGYEHVFSESLHVVIEAEMEENAALRALSRAKEEIEQLLVPVPEDRDILKKQQLRDLAMINGTFRTADGSPTLFGATSRDYSGELNLAGASAYGADLVDELHFQLDDVTLEDDTPSAPEGGGSASAGAAVPSGGFPSSAGIVASTRFPSYYDSLGAAAESLAASVHRESSETITIEQRKPPALSGREGWPSASPAVSNPLFASSLPTRGHMSSSPAKWSAGSFAGLGGPGPWWGTQGPMSYQPQTNMAGLARGVDAISSRDRSREQGILSLDDHLQAVRGADIQRRETPLSDSGRDHFPFHCEDDLHQRTQPLQQPPPLQAKQLQQPQQPHPPHLQPHQQQQARGNDAGNTRAGILWGPDSGVHQPLAKSVETRKTLSGATSKQSPAEQ